MGIGGFFRGIGRFFAKVFGSDALKKVGEAAEAVLKSEAGKLIYGAVSAVGSLGLSNEAARKEAFDRAKAQLVASGHDVRDSFINLAIELAVQRLKSLVSPE